MLQDPFMTVQVIPWPRPILFLFCGVHPHSEQKRSSHPRSLSSKVFGRFLVMVSVKTDTLIIAI